MKKAKILHLPLFPTAITNLLDYRELYYAFSLHIFNWHFYVSILCKFAW